MFSTYALSSAICQKAMLVNDVMQLLCKIKVGSSAWVNRVAYRCDSVFSMGARSSQFAYELRVAIKTFVAHKTESSMLSDDRLQV